MNSNQEIAPGGHAPTFGRSALFVSSFDKGLTFDEYEKLIAQLSQTPIESARDEVDRTHLLTARINLQRTTRIMKSYEVSGDQQAVLEGILTPQNWMVLSEPWCGDSAQSVPYIWKLAESASRVTCRLLLRDANPEIMDRYLTNGTRGIPKLVAFSADGSELFRWGPRPREAQEAFEAARSSGLSKTEALEKLHLWYGRNRGDAILKEILDLVALHAGHPID